MIQNLTTKPPRHSTLPYHCHCHCNCCFLYAYVTLTQIKSQLFVVCSWSHLPPRRSYVAHYCVLPDQDFLTYAAHTQLPLAPLPFTSTLSSIKCPMASSLTPQPKPVLSLSETVQDFSRPPPLPQCTKWHSPTTSAPYSKDHSATYPTHLHRRSMTAPWSIRKTTLLFPTTYALSALPLRR